MNQMLVQKRIGKSIIVTCILLLLQTPFALGADDIMGEWEMKMDFGGRESFATMTISKKADGTRTGKWGSQELSDVKFEDGKLTFVRTIRFGDQEFTMEYEGTLKDGKITGTMSSDRGEFAANGARRKPKLPVLGHWDIDFNVGEREINARLSISEKPDGTLEGKWDEEGEHVLSNVKFKDGKLTLTRDSKIEDFEFQTTCELTAKGNELTGTMKSDMGDLQVNGKRVGAELIGKWKLTTTSDFGTRTSMMRIDGDLTGRYEFFGGEIPMKNVKLEGDQVTFLLEMGFGDRTFQMDFKGKLDGKTLKGELTSERGTSQVVGKKAEAASPIIGTWEFTRETQRGTRTSTLKIREDMTATYTVRDNELAVTDFKVDGNQISFKVIMRYGDREVPMEFKGKVDGTTLVGERTTSRGTSKVAGKKIN
jgi:hypothetical protein